MKKLREGWENLLSFTDAFTDAIFLVSNHDRNLKSKKKVNPIFQLEAKLLRQVRCNIKTGWDSQPSLRKTIFEDEEFAQQYRALKLEGLSVNQALNNIHLSIADKNVLLSKNAKLNLIVMKLFGCRLSVMYADWNLQKNKKRLEDCFDQRNKI